MSWIAFLCLVSWFGLVWVRGDFWKVDWNKAVPMPDRWPDVAVVIPARNEAEGIGQTVASLLSQEYPANVTVLVVDDHSDDGTADVARAAAGLHADRLHILSGSELAAGWTGKVWAMEQGRVWVRENAPQTEYVLFTDGDIEHAPGQLKDLVARALWGRFDLTSLMVRLSCRTWPERILIPAFVHFFRMLYPFHLIADPGSAVAGAAGGVMLIRRHILDDMGGFAVLKGALIDDCSLAAAIKARMGRLWLGLAPKTRSLRVYGTWLDVWNMIARSAYDQLNHSPLLLVGTVLGMGLVFVAPVVLTFAGSGAAQWVGGFTWGAMVMTYWPMLRYYGVNTLWAPLLPFVALFYLGATIASAWRHMQGRGGEWKGRIEAGRKPTDRTGP